MEPFIYRYPQVSVRLAQNPGKKILTLENPDVLLPYNLDVILVFGNFSNIEVDPGEVSRYGIWIHKYCDTLLRPDTMPGFSEIIQSHLTTRVCLTQRIAMLQPERTIYNSWSSTRL